MLNRSSELVAGKIGMIIRGEREGRSQDYDGKEGRTVGDSDSGGVSRPDQHIVEAFAPRYMAASSFGRNYFSLRSRNHSRCHLLRVPSRKVAVVAAEVCSAIPLEFLIILSPSLTLPQFPKMALFEVEKCLWNLNSTGIK